LFANHGLHPKFDIQVMNKIMSLVIEDWAMWLANVQAQLIYNIEESQRWYKENVNEHRKEQPNFQVGD
jgi:gluconate kinase